MRINIGMISLLCLAMLPLAARAETASQKGTSEAIEQAYHRGDEAALLKVRAGLEAATKAGHPDKYSYYYLGLSDYELAVTEEDEGKASGYIAAAEEALQAAVKLDPAFAEAEALLGSSYGVDIGLHPMKGMFLSSQNTGNLDRAAKHAPGNPRVLLLQGISDYATPEAYGGDKKRAMAEFRSALAAFDTYKQPDAQAPSWGRAETHVWLAKAEANSKDYTAARADLAAALKIAPGYKFAQGTLAKLPPAPRGESGSGLVLIHRQIRNSPRFAVHRGRGYFSGMRPRSISPFEGRIGAWRERVCGGSWISFSNRAASWPSSSARSGKPGRRNWIPGRKGMGRPVTQGPSPEACRRAWTSRCPINAGIPARCR